MKEIALSNNIVIKGFGLHKNKFNIINIKPNINNNIAFSFNNHNATLNAILDNVFDTNLNIAFKYKNFYARSTEHLLSSLFILNITSCNINFVLGDEIPALDGSSFQFINHIINSKPYITNNYIPIINLISPIAIKINDSFIAALPNYNNSISFNAFIHFKKYNLKQHFKTTFSQTKFINQIAKARTFGFYDMWDSLKKQGKALGANYYNTQVFQNNNIINPSKLHNEAARHKILDFCASLALLKARVCADFYLYKSGHHLDLLFVKLLNQLTSKTYPYNLSNNFQYKNISTNNNNISTDEKSIYNLIKQHFND